jgi:hypothetical protein
VDDILTAAVNGKINKLFISCDFQHLIIFID